MEFDPVSLGVQASLSGIKSLAGLLTGGSQRRTARRMLRNLQYPTERMPVEIERNQKLAELRANTGLPSEQYNNAMKNIQRQQLMALKGAGDRRGALSILSGTQQSANDALLNLDMADAKARLANENTLMSANNNLANWKSRLFDANVRQKYNRDYNYAMSLLGMGNKNLLGAFDNLGAGLGLAAGASMSGKNSNASGNIVDYGFEKNKYEGTQFPY